jgi:hypothetical protein
MFDNQYKKTNTLTDEEVREFSYLIQIMNDAIKLLPTRTTISHLMEDKRRLNLYKDPNERVWWQWRPEKGKFCDQREVKRND